MDSRELQRQICAPFEPADVEWRVQQAGVSAGGKPWVMVVPYITSRAVQQRLDDVFGLNWQLTQKPTPDGKGYLCGISAKVGDEWVTRWDGAEYTDIEPLKGALSGAMKRAGVQFGIGRYLYQMDDAIFADCKEVKSRRDCVGHYQRIKQKNGSVMEVDWTPPQLPAWALPRKDYSVYTKAIESASDLDELKTAYVEAYQAAKANLDREQAQRFEMLKDQAKARIQDQAALNVEANLTATRDWLLRQISSFDKVPNEQAVTAIYKAASNELDKRAKGMLFDPAPLRHELKEAYDANLTRFHKEEQL